MRPRPQGKPLKGESAAPAGILPQGEFISIPDRLVVSPGWGRVHLGALTEGQVIQAGARIGRLIEGGHNTLLICPVRAVFVGWLVFEGERVAPGSPLARLRRWEG
jgi:hypothetical protein